MRGELRRRCIQAVISRKGSPTIKGLGKLRYVVEQTFAACSTSSNAAVRMERRIELHDAFLSRADPTGPPLLFTHHSCSAQLRAGVICEVRHEVSLGEVGIAIAPNKLDGSDLKSGCCTEHEHRVCTDGS
ncbi:hypothetical protein ACFY1B_31995 [Streptomyces mirabilis]|uniref:hypothetical protein n=1 Tax=Streptomyces mirabilis TaxID=68239 RepID=UPI00368A22BE